MSIFNDFARTGVPYKANQGQRFTNNSGGLVKQGQVVAIDITDATLSKVVCTAASTNAGKNYPVVVALNDVASGSDGVFVPLGLVNAVVANSATGRLSPDTTNTTGGNVLIAYSKASGTIGCGWTAATGDGSTAVAVVFDGMSGRAGGFVS